MGNQSSGLTFAIVGHLDSWKKAEKLTNAGRATPLPMQTIKEVYSFIPPRKIFDIEVTSPITGIVKGAYVETFIAPDELDHPHLGKNLEKVKQACRCASSLSADIVSLGGFSSIILETCRNNFDRLNGTAFTTGNTLTAALIVDAVEKACHLLGQPLEECNLLVVGSTGDIGSACVNYFAGFAKKLLLGARQVKGLQIQVTEMQDKKIACSGSTDLNNLLPYADIIICAASTSLAGCDLRALRSHVIICDAGYPKNLQSIPHLTQHRIFNGGMGLVKNGIKAMPDYQKEFYEPPLENIVHGCVLESIVLAMERKPVPYSYGRGNITKEAMKDILVMAARHGFVTAPFFNENGMWTRQRAERFQIERYNQNPS